MREMLCVIAALTGVCAVGAGEGRDLSGYANLETVKFASALQKRIDETSAKGGGVVRLEKGTWKSEGLALKDNVTLELAEGCLLEATTNTFLWPNPGAFIWAKGAKNVALVGKGRIDVHGERYTFRDGAPGRPKAVLFRDVKGLKVYDVTITRPASWTLHLQCCEDVHVRGVKIRATVNFNNDGIDIEARKCLIEDCDIDSDDDAICFKSDTPAFPIEDVEVRNCLVSSSCNFIKFGTGSCGRVRRVNIHDCKIFARTHSTVRDYARWRKNLPGGIEDCANGIAAVAIEVVDGGSLEQVTVRDLEISGCWTPVFIRHGARRGKDGGFLRGVRIENVKGSCLSRMASSITGVAGRRVRDVTLRNFDLTYPGGATAEMLDKPVPEKENSYPEARCFEHILPGWAFYVRHADNIRFENVKVRLAQPDVRKNALVCDDATGVVCEGCSFEGLGLSQYVDPFIGTSGTANCYPNACVPHGMVQNGPASGTGAWKYCGGYQFADEKLYGFVQDGISGTGACDLGDLLIQPFVGAGEDTEYRAVKSDEGAYPGFYGVTYPNQANLRSEGTAAGHSAFWRFTYGGGDAKPHLMLDLQWGNLYSYNSLRYRVQLCEVQFPDAHTMTGRLRIRNWVDRFCNFCIRFDRPVRPRKIEPRLPGRGDRYIFDFDLPGNKGELKVKIGLSATSPENAMKNLDAELPDWNFVRARDAATAAWNDYFARLRVEGTEEQKTTFYTSLWHLGIAPNMISDVGEKPRYSTLSFWDTFRAAHPLFTLIQPERVSGFVESCMKGYAEQGFLPIWELWGKDNQCMIGSHAVPVMVDAYLKGFPMDAPAVYAAIRDSLTQPHPRRVKERWDLIDKYGYYPCDIIRGESVSRLMECAYDDWCAGAMAERLGKTEDAAFFRKRSGNYRNVFDKSIGLVRGRTTTGAWREPFDPLLLGHGAENDNDFTEGNAWQYTWHVMQDPEGLIALFGGKESFARQLDHLFDQEARIYGHDKWDVTGLIGQYAHGNEPSHHVVYFYPYVDLPRRTADLVREICDKFYRNAPDGLSGNDDCGQMSAWYLFSAMGFYPFNPCGGDYVIGAPQVPKVVLSLPGGKTLTVVAKNFSRWNRYVRSCSLNGQKVEGYILRHADLTKGGELVFDMCE